MKNLILILLCIISCFACKSNLSVPSNQEANAEVVNDTVSIRNDELEYEIIIIDPGYATFLASRARPEGFYSQDFLEQRNRLYVLEWNQRVLQPSRFDPNLYELRIDYDYNTDYGYEVNYKLYNYFIYFQLKYNQRLGSYTPRI